MKAVVSVAGRNAVGIIAKVSNVCFACNGDILDISQKVMHEYFTMMMIVEIEKLNVSFSEFIDKMEKLGRENNLEIHAMHEDIFDAMHKI